MRRLAHYLNCKSTLSGIEISVISFLGLPKSVEDPLFFFAI